MNERRIGFSLPFYLFPSPFSVSFRVNLWRILFLRAANSASGIAGMALRVEIARFSVTHDLQPP